MSNQGPEVSTQEQNPFKFNDITTSSRQPFDINAAFNSNNVQKTFVEQLYLSPGRANEVEKPLEIKENRIIITFLDTEDAELALKLLQKYFNFTKETPISDGRYQILMPINITDKNTRFVSSLTFWLSIELVALRKRHENDTDKYTKITAFSDLVFQHLIFNSYLTPQQKLDLSEKFSDLLQVMSAKELNEKRINDALSELSKKFGEILKTLEQQPAVSPELKLALYTSLGILIGATVGLGIGLGSIALTLQQGQTYLSALQHLNGQALSSVIVAVVTGAVMIGALMLALHIGEYKQQINRKEAFESGKKLGDFFNMPTQTQADTKAELATQAQLENVYKFAEMVLELKPATPSQEKTPTPTQ